MSKQTYEIIKRAYRVGTKEGLKAPASDERTLVHVAKDLKGHKATNEAKLKGKVILGLPYLELRAHRAPDADLYDYEGIPLTESQLTDRVNAESEPKVHHAAPKPARAEHENGDMVVEPIDHSIAEMGDKRAKKKRRILVTALIAAAALATIAVIIFT